MSRWFRFYDEVVNDPKVQRLPGDKFKSWVNLLCLASSNGGVLPALADLSFALRIAEPKLSALLEEFSKMELLDRIDVSGSAPDYAPHNWNGRQFKSDVSNDRVKRFRQRKRNVTPSDSNGPPTVTETPPDSDTESDSVSSKKKKQPPEGGLLDSKSDPDADLYVRGKEVLGNNAGGLISRLKDHFKGSIALARASIEQASTKQDAREYIGAIIRGKREDQADKAHLVAGQWDGGI